MAPPNARMMTSWIFMARSRAAAASTIVTSLIDDGCSATPGKSGHFTCSRERTDHVLPTFPDRGVDRITRAAYRNGAMPYAPIVLKGPGRFKDPANLTWERYIALQTRERERYLAERATIPQDALDFKSVNPRYLERAI